ncbi:DEAD-box ATP-dependent RNA helicase 47-mitochondrial [Striga hermonthica]|uniref:RNA helicase n=1 Tax=Striga hermonthica TaxID=68872 RepID=A0A9N7P2K6_STRHE|nr:DEAD-box ATP-dependent RNA helicase 47-mitochondrial [Striga hermonthica]
MSALAASRVLLLMGDTLSATKSYGFSRIAAQPSGVRFFGRVSTKSEPLTLANLGFKGEIKAGKGNEKNKLKLGVSTIEVPKRREKPVTPKETKVIKTKERVDVAALAPFAAKSFSELGLPPLLVERLEKEGYKVPTDVQAAAIPTILKDHDVVIQSYTGSGKTLAYLLPILSEVGPLGKDSDGHRARTDVEAVVVAPSRELGMQIVREVEKLLGPSDKRMVQQLVGGANKARQEEALKKNKPAIVVGTPGRIAEISASGKLRTHGCRFLVLDEVDELLAFNFREDMHRIVEHARGMKATELHGDLGKLARSTILKKLRNGDVRVLLTNELSARGLDIPECDLVVNLELPTDPIHYAHRAGRTGRLGRKGNVVTICEEQEVFVVRKMQKQLEVVIKPCQFAEGNLVVDEEE